MVEFLRWLREFLGLVLPRENEPAVNEMAVPHAAPPRVGGGYVLGFDTVLPGMRGRVAVPIVPGRTMIVGLNRLTMVDAYGAFQYLAEAREKWPFAADPNSFDAYVALEGPGWNLTAFVRESGSRVEYFAGRAGEVSTVTGRVTWEHLVQALVLCPDYDAVVGYLTMNPYGNGYYVV